MKKIIIIVALIIAVGGSILGYCKIEYDRTYYADGMLEAADRLGEATDNYISSGETVTNELAGADTTKIKDYMRTQAEQKGIKLKELSDKELQKMKEKNEDIKQDIYDISEQMNSEEVGSRKYKSLQKKYYSLLEKQNEYEIQISYNEL